MDYKSILIVEDDAPSRQAIRHTLWTGGYAAEEAADGARALRRLGTGPFDLLVTDILMPGLDGFELIRAVKRDHPGVLTLAMAEAGGLWGLDLLDVALALGADGALAKPFSTDQLLRAVARLAGPGRRRGTG